MIIFINGASSSGKTSLARALQEQWSGPLTYWSLDSVISQLPYRYTGSGADANEGFPLTATPDGAHEIGVGVTGLKLNQLSAQYLQSLAASGFDIVADFVLLNEAVLAPYQAALAQIPLLFVGLYCDPAALYQRNQQRADRAAGLSQRQQETVHFCAAQYDLRLDSTVHSSSELCAALTSHLTATRVTPGF